MSRKVPVTLQIDLELYDKIMEVAAREYEGNRSYTLRQLLRRGLAEREEART